MSDHLLSRLKLCSTVTADGAALKEVAHLLLVLVDAPDQVLECIQGYLKSRYRQPVYIVTPDDIDPADAFIEAER